MLFQQKKQQKANKSFDSRFAAVFFLLPRGFRHREKNQESERQEIYIAVTKQKYYTYGVVSCLDSFTNHKKVEIEKWRIYWKIFI